MDSVFENFAALLLPAAQLTQLAAVGLDSCDGLIAADPISYAAELTSTTPTLMQLVGRWRK